MFNRRIVGLARSVNYNFARIVSLEKVIIRTRIYASEWITSKTITQEMSYRCTGDETSKTRLFVFWKFFLHRNYLKKYNYIVYGVNIIPFCGRSRGHNRKSHVRGWLAFEMNTLRCYRNHIWTILNGLKLKSEFRFIKGLTLSVPYVKKWIKFINAYYQNWEFLYLLDYKVKRTSRFLLFAYKC